MGKELSDVEAERWRMGVNLNFDYSVELQAGGDLRAS